MSKKIVLILINFIILFVWGFLNEGNTQTYEIENMPIKTTGVPITGGWLLDTEGYVADTINFSIDGFYSFTIATKGRKDDDEWPFMEVRVDNLVSGPVVVDNLSWENYQVISNLEAGRRQIAFAYINDSGSRSLYLDKVTISPINVDDSDWLLKFTEAIMNRFPEPWTYDITRWQIEELMWGVAKAYEISGDDRYLNYVRSHLDDHVDSNGNLDIEINDIIPGILLLWLYEATGEERFLTAAIQVGEYLLNEFPRTSDGGFAHQERYEDQLWVDTLGGLGRLLGMLGYLTGDTKYFDEGAQQFIIHANHLQNAQTGLFYHGWDEDGSAEWAVLPNHCSPCFWARGNGWVIRGITDFLEYLPEDHPNRSQVIAILQALVEGIVNYQDDLSGLWFTVIDRGSDEGNYLETSGSMLFAYGMQKGINLGVLDGNYQINVDRANKGLYCKVYEKEDGEVIVTGISVGTSPGNYEYYVGREVRTGYDYPYGDGIFLQEKSEMVRHQGASSYDISGNVLYYDNNSPIPNVNLVLSKGAQHVVQTGSDGFYSFQNLPENRDYSIYINKLADSDIGPYDITTYDAALAAQAAVGMRELSSYQGIAADVNLDGLIYTFDAALIAHYAVEMPKLPESHVGEWVFDPDSLYFENLDRDYTGQNFTGILLGNVHGGWTQPGSNVTQKHVFKPYGKLKNLAVACFDTVEIPLYLPDEPNVIALDVEMNYDSQVLNFIGIKQYESAHEAKLFYSVKSGRLRIGVFNTEPLKPGIMVGIKFFVNEKAARESMITLDRFQLNDDIIYQGQFHVEVRINSEIPQNYKLYQNFPNPFQINAGTMGTQIFYDLPKESRALIKIYNCLGQEIRQLTDQLTTAGRHVVYWDGRDHSGNDLAPGVYFYRLEAEDYVEYKKMILLR